MNVEQIEKKLKNCKKLDMLIKKLQLKLVILDQGLLVGSNQIGTRVTTSKINTIENKILKTIQLKDEIIEQLTTLVKERLEVMDLIDHLSDYEEWLTITKLYVLSEDVSIVCKDLRLSKTQLYKVRKKAIERLGAEVNNSYDRLGFE